MADAVTVTGVSETKAAVALVAARLESRMKAVAFVTANRIAATARGLARAHGWQQTPTEIAVRDGNTPGRVIPGSVKSAVAEIDRANAEKLAYIVEVQPVYPRPANLPYWLEFGTRKMLARPFMWPAAQAHRSAYVADQERELQSLFDETVNH